MPQRPGHEAMLYETLPDEKVQCRLCGHECLIAAGKFGLCRVRQNVQGRLLSRNYDAVVAVNVDPIEKKPLFHFLPGTLSLSLAAAGCNFQCAFCQNWQISQAPRTGKLLTGQAIAPEALVAAAKEHSCRSLSYTYTEPTVFFELAYDTCRLAHQENMKNCFVSNGFLTPRAIRTIAPYLDAINVDLKAFSDQTYRQVMKARLEPVLTALKELRRCGVWVEITTLVVPGMNDGEPELTGIARFIARELSVDVPWHVSRFHGDYQMEERPPTPVATLRRAVEIGRAEGLRFVYSGNVPGDADENTRCPGCRKLLLRRVGFSVTANALIEGACPDCRTPIPGIW